MLWEYYVIRVHVKYPLVFFFFFVFRHNNSVRALNSTITDSIYILLDLGRNSFATVSGTDAELRGL